MEGKQRAEDERGTRKRPRVVVEETEVQAEETERVERSWKEDSGLLLGAKVARAIWQLSNRLSSVAEELAASWEALYLCLLRLYLRLLHHTPWPFSSPPLILRPLFPLHDHLLESPTGFFELSTELTASSTPGQFP